MLLCPSAFHHSVAPCSVSQASARFCTLPLRLFLPFSRLHSFILSFFFLLPLFSSSFATLVSSLLFRSYSHTLLPLLLLLILSSHSLSLSHINTISRIKRGGGIHKKDGNQKLCLRARSHTANFSFLFTVHSFYWLVITAIKQTTGEQLTFDEAFFELYTNR